MVSAASFPHVFETPRLEAERSLVPVVSAPKGSVGFVPSADLARILEQDAQDGFLTVTIPAPKPVDRGHLALLVEEAVEVALERHGGSPPGLLTESDLDASLSDQLYRARLLEFRGLTIAFGPLAALAGASGVLDVEDSAALRFWCDAPTSRPVRVRLDEENTLVGAYGPPRRLGEMLQRASKPLHAVPDDEPVPAGELARALVVALAEPASDVPSVDEAIEEAPPTERPGSESLRVEKDAEEPLSTPEAPSAAASESEHPLFTEEAAETSQIRPATLGPLHEQAAEQWPIWLRDLEGARGPKPLASIERMFAKSYVPLRDAYLRGIAPPEVGSVLEGWATSFAKSYTETWSALRVRTKRPTMVLDVPDVALRIGRLHGARSVQLLLVDGLRFDLGLRFEALLRERLGHEAALTERLLLWSALPSDTATQLDLLGRGPDALRGLERTGDSDVMVARGRMARVPRRVKAGHRELLKLDIVEAELGELGGSETERLDALAVPLTDSIAELCEKLPTRTLLVVFGDHGFVFEKLESGGTVARQGGSRPEEVLVPAFAWLVGGVQ